MYSSQGQNLQEFEQQNSVRRINLGIFTGMSDFGISTFGVLASRIFRIFGVLVSRIFRIFGVKISCP
jgi:hypothetical protein